MVIRALCRSRGVVLLRFSRACSTSAQCSGAFCSGALRLRVTARRAALTPSSRVGSGWSAIRWSVAKEANQRVTVVARQMFGPAASGFMKTAPAASRSSGGECAYTYAMRSAGHDGNGVHSLMTHQAYGELRAQAARHGAVARQTLARADAATKRERKLLRDLGYAGQQVAELQATIEQLRVSAAKPVLRLRRLSYTTPKSLQSAQRRPQSIRRRVRVTKRGRPQTQSPAGSSTRQAGRRHLKKGI